MVLSLIFYIKKSMAEKYVPSLNGLRALSIGIVVAVHCGFKNFNTPQFPGGQFGVNIFFVLSGFLITLLLLEEEKLTNTISLKKFYVRRVLRIFPVYCILLVTYYVLQMNGVLRLSTNSWLSAIFYLKDIPVGNSYSWETDHLWSLSVEEHFYLLWPLIFKSLRQYRVKIALAFIVLIPIIRGVLFGLNQNSEGTTVYERADALLWGCLLAIYYQPVSIMMMRAIRKYQWAVFLPFLGLLFSVAAPKVIPINNSIAEGLFRALGRADGTITNIFICMAIVIAVNSRNSLFYKFLNTDTMNYLGKISYSLYIWQQLFFSSNIGGLGTFPLNIVCIFVVSIFSYHFIEKPFLAIKSRYDMRRITPALARRAA
jgi:peptidoglycan/LPS O-acetylase OafA/YrhL